MGSFFELGSIFALSILLAWFVQAVRLPFILGYLLVGVLAGPVALNLIQAHEALEVFSQLGVASLLFVIGLGLHPSLIREIGKPAALIGLGQVACTAIAGWVLNRWLGFSGMASVFLSLALTFSSTIILSKALADRREEGTLHGKISLGILLVQDLVATALLVVLSYVLRPASESVPVSMLLAKVIFLTGIIFLVAKYILPRFTRLFAASQEFLLLFSIAWMVGVSVLFQLVGLSIEVGALVAGVALASSPYRFEIGSKMRLIRDLFLVVFFVSLGSHLTWDGISSVAFPALVLSAFVLILKPLFTMILMGLLKYNKRTSFLTGLGIAQVSEFSFVLLLLAIKAGYASNELLSLATLVGMLTIAISSIGFSISHKIFRVLSPLLSVFERKGAVHEMIHEERFSAILFGCHRVGMDFIQTLEKKNLSYLVVDFDPGVVQQLELRGVPCRYGDAGDNEFLEELHLSQVKLIISTIPDHESNLALLAKVKKHNPEAILILIAHSPQEARLLYEEGATYVIMPHFLGGNYAAMLLEKYGLSGRKFGLEKIRHLKHLEHRML